MFTNDLTAWIEHKRQLLTLTKIINSLIAPRHLRGDRDA